MFLEWADQAGGQHGDPIVQAFAIAHDNLLVGKVEIFDAEPQTLHQAQARAVENLGHQCMGPREGPNDLQGFSCGQHPGQACGLAGPDGIDGPAEQLSEHVAGEEQ